MEDQNILDTEPEPAFGRVARLAADLLGVGSALVNFIGKDRQWFKSAVGFDEKETGLDVSFCVYTIEKGEALVIEDAAEDERLANNPYVTEKGVRFYAGVPLEMEEGHRIGTLCVLSAEPQSPSEEAIRQLSDLAAIVEDELRLRREQVKRQEREKQLRMLAQAAEQAGESVLITEAEPLDEPGPRIVYVNEAFEEMTGYGEEEVLGRTPRLLQGPETRRAALEELRAALEAGETWAGETINYRKDGTPYHQEWTLAPVRGEDGTVEHWVSVQRDVTEERRREEKLRRQKALLTQTQRLAGAWEADLEAEEVSLTETARRIYGAAPGAGPGDTEFGDTEFGTVGLEEAFEGFAPEAQSKIREAFWRCVREGTPYDLELPFVTAEGERKHVRTVGAPTETRDGEIVKVAGALQDITARKEAEQKLRRSRERYRSLFRDSSDAILIHDLEGTVKEVNPQAESLFGLEAEALRGRSLEQLHEASEAEVAQEKLSALREGKDYEAVSRYKQAGGPTFWGEVSASAVEIGGETVVRSLIRDVTDRVESRRELEQYREYTSHLLDAIDDLFFSIDEEARFCRWNDSVSAVTGYTDAEIEEMTAFGLVPESEHDRVATKITEALETGSAQIEVPLVRKDGTQISYEFAGSLVEHPEGGLRVVGIGRDITERRRRKRELERQNDLFTKAQDIANVGAWEHDVASGESVVTDEVCRIHGFSPGGDLPPERSIEAFHPEDRPTIRKAFRRAVQDGESYDLELRLITEGGEDRWVRTRGEPQQEDGEVARVRGTIQDVTTRVERRQALREAKEAAEEADRIKTALLSNMNHEFRTPLTSIITFSELISEDPDVAGQFAGRILGGGKRLLYTLNTVMDFAELEGGSKSATPKSTHPGEVVRSVTSNFQERAHKEGIDLSADVSGQVGTSFLDEHLLERTLIHLVHNAIKFTEGEAATEGKAATEDGEVAENGAAATSGAVTVFARVPGEAAGTTPSTTAGNTTGDAVEIGVEDTGVGIDPDFLPRVFDEFAQQSTGSDRTHEGNGLGLTIAKRFVEKMGGAINVESEPGTGTVVTVRLPGVPTSSED